MYVRIGRIYASPIFLAVIAFFCIVDSVRYTVLLLTAAALHEAGHLAAALRFGAPIEGIYLQPFGINIRIRESCAVSYPADACIALAGPMASLAAAAAAFGYSAIFGLGEGSAFFLMTNLLLMSLNLLPVDTLDGGRALRALLLMRMLPDAADRICFTVSVIVLCPLCFAAVWAALRSGYNFSLIAVCLFLLLRLALQSSSRISVST